MATNTLPRSIRDQAYEVFTARLGRTPSHVDRLADLGGVVLVNLLIDLELEFGIGLDPDEVLPNGTFGVLVGLVEIRARAAGRRVDPVEACRVYDLAMERANRGASDDRRARRARSAMHSAPDDDAWDRCVRVQRAERRAQIAMLCLGSGSLAGAFAAIVVFAQANGWFW